MSFSQHYHEELSYMREMLREFVEKYPDMESILGEYGGDEGVEHLLQSYAFLAARLKEKIDDDIPEVIHDACRIVAPQFLRTFPSCSILEYKPDFTTSKGRTRIQQGTEVKSQPIDGTECRFRTTWPLDILPLEIENVEFDRPRSSRPVLRIQLRTTEIVDESLFDSQGIRFYLHGPREVTADLMYYIRKYSFMPAVRTLENPGPAFHLDNQVSPVGWEKEQAIFIWDSQLPQAYRLLLEYYIFPEKFMFFDVNLASCRSQITSRFELQLRFDRPVEFASKITKETLRLNCVPVTNLFECYSQPIHCDIDTKLEAHEYLVQANALPPEHAEIFHIIEVAGKSTPDAAKVEYEPFCSLKQAGTKRERKLFHERREFNPLGDLDVYIKPHANEKDEILNLRLLCTNRALAGRVRAGDIGGHDQGSVEITYKNLIDASRPVLPPLERNLWGISGVFSLNQIALQKVQTLKENLNIFNFQTSVDESIGEANRRRVESITSIDVQKRRQVIKQLPRVGIRIRIQIEEADFAGHGDIFLFGCVLGKILASPYTPGGYSELILILQPSNTEMKLGCELGTRPMM